MRINALQAVSMWLVGPFKGEISMQIWDETIGINIDSSALSILIVLFQVTCLAFTHLHAVRHCAKVFICGPLVSNLPHVRQGLGQESHCTCPCLKVGKPQGNIWAFFLWWCCCLILWQGTFEVGSKFVSTSIVLKLQVDLARGVGCSFLLFPVLTILWSVLKFPL